MRAGVFSRELLSTKHFAHLTGIDAWGDVSRGHENSEYITALKALRSFREKSTVIRMFFEHATAAFEGRLSVVIPTQFCDGITRFYAFSPRGEQGSAKYRMSTEKSSKTTQFCGGITRFYAFCHVVSRGSQNIGPGRAKGNIG